MKQFVRSLSHAIRGVRSVAQSQRNARIQWTAALAAVGLAWWFEISRYEWMVLIVCIGIVSSAEAMNTALERLCDRIHPEPDRDIGRIKDAAAAAVFLVSLAAAVVGCLIFLPKWFD